MLNEFFTGVLLKQRGLDIRKEIFRKSIHLCTAFVPFFLARFYFTTLWLLMLCLVFYCIFEFLRLGGKKVPFISAITAAAARKRDENNFVMGPVTLVLGIISAAILWKQIPAAVGIYALGFGDGLASLVGKLCGRIRIPFTNGKTVAGSLACFAAVFISSLLMLHSVSAALVIGFAAMAIELLPLKDFDNLFIPVLTGGLAQFILA